MATTGLVTIKEVILGVNGFLLNSFLLSSPEFQYSGERYVPVVDRGLELENNMSSFYGRLDRLDRKQTGPSLFLGVNSHVNGSLSKKK